MILNSPYISGSLTVTGNEVVTGSLTVLGGITGAITGSATSASYAFNSSYLNNSGSGEFVPTGSFNTFSSSILSYTASNNTNIGNIHSTTASLNTFSGSTNSRLSSIESTTASLNAASGSAITRLSALEVTSGSNITRISALESSSGSAITRLSSLESKTGSYATTGSNTFDGGQYISQSSNPTGFTTTASLYTDGGLRVAKDAYISGTLYLNNVTVYGTQSVCYITSSQLNIASNLISVNTATPSVRFGGLAVYDSGSTGLTGSILWDSQNNHWVYSNPSGSSYSGGMFISGPRTSTLGSETGTTACMLLAGQGGDHLTSSMIYHDSTVTCFHGNSFISSSGAACFQGNTTIGGNLNVGNSSTTSSITITGTSVGGFTAGYIGWGSGNQVTPGLYLSSPGTNVEITTGFNERIALSTGTGLEIFTNSGSGPYTSRLLLNRSGNLGIGVSPASKLDVAGNITINGSCVSNVAQLNLTRTDTSWGIHNETNLRFYSGAGTTTSPSLLRFQLDSNGIACFACQVCAPATTIRGTINEQLVLDFIVGAGSYTHQSFRLCGTNQYRLIGDTNGSFILRNDIVSSNVLTFACAGAATFSSSVTAGGDINLSNDKGIFIKRADSTLGQTLFLDSSNNLNIGFGVADAIRFATYLNTERMRITSDGKILVGTTNADIGGSVAGVGIMSDGRILASICCTGTLCHIFMGDRRGTSSEGPVFMMARGGFYKSTIGVLGTADSLNNGGITFSTVCGNDAICERMRITSSGRIGFGSTAPCARIETSGGGYILRGGWGLFCTAYTDDGLFSGCATPNLLSTNAYGGANTKFGSDSGLVLGYQDNGAGLYSPAYGFEVKSTDGRPVTGNVVKAIVMRDTDTGAYPFWINNNGSAYFANCVGIGTSSPSDKLQVLGSMRWGGSSVNVVSSNDASGVYLELNGTSTATRRLRLQGINDAGNKYSQFFINAGSSEFCFVTEDAQRLLIGNTGIATFACTVCSGGSIIRKGFDAHTNGQWYKIPFYMEKGTGTSVATTQCLIVINNNDGFQEMHFTIEYGSRLQGVSDSYTQTSLRTYGVNRFVSGTATVNDVYLITGGSGCNINTHAPMTVNVVGNCMTVVKVDFSSSIGGSSFVWGEVRIWSIESLAGKITVSNNNY